MKSVFGFEANFNKLDIASSTRMLRARGEGELEIKNQGRFGLRDRKGTLGHSNSFSQETIARGQQTPRIGDVRPKRRELSAGCTLNSDSTPHFFLLNRCADGHRIPS